MRKFGLNITANKNELGLSGHDREDYIFNRYNEGGITYRELGSLFNVTLERARQIYMRARWREPNRSKWIEIHNKPTQ